MKPIRLLAIVGSIVFLAGCENGPNPNESRFGNVRFRGNSEVQKDEIDGTSETKVTLKASSQY